MSKVSVPKSLAGLMQPIDDLVADPHNARTHDDRNLQSIEDSLKQFGWRSVIVVRQSDQTILSGNGRIEAARRLGLKKAPIIYVRCTDQEAKAYALADNRTAELADWDFDVLTQTLIDLDVDVPGFDIEEINNLVGHQTRHDDEQTSLDDDDQEGREAAAVTTQNVTLRMRVPRGHKDDALARMEGIAADVGGEVIR